MRINGLKSFFFSSIMGIVLAFSACTDSIERESSPIPTDGVQAYIYSETPSSFNFIPSDEQVVEVTIGRQTTEATTVHFESEGEGFNIPTTLDFAEGEQKKNLRITFNMPIGETGSFILRIAENDVYTYSRSEITCNVARNYKYTEIGKGSFTSSFFGQPGECIFEKAEGADWYKAVGPYEEGYDILFKVQDDGKTVVVEKQAVASKYDQYKTLFAAGQGTMENGVITVNASFSVAEGSFQGSFEEKFILPIK